jgi:hypothetical protein
MHTLNITPGIISGIPGGSELRHHNRTRLPLRKRICTGG